MSRKKRELVQVGKKYNMLLVLERIGKNKHNKVMWKCRCDCGGLAEVISQNLTCGVTKSCGCLVLAGSRKTHGMRDTRIYRIWCGMKSRCNNPGSSNSIYYCEKGISYNESWETFEGFFSDMGGSYVDGYEIERLDNNLGYSRENCIWISKQDQSRHRGIRSDNSSGVTGVSPVKNKAGVLIGFKAAWRNYDEGVPKEKRKVYLFKLFGDKAFSLACEKRKEELEKLRNNGFNYHKDHGL